MDNFDFSRPAPRKVDDQPIPFGDDPPGKAGISHSPLNLGGSAKPEPETITPEAKAQPAPPAPAASAPSAAPGSSERITGIKTFFTKLHAGALNFLDEQITDWLKKNPDIEVKRTNTIYGDVVGKKTEPNIVISVWY